MGIEFTEDDLKGKTASKYLGEGRHKVLVEKIEKTQSKNGNDMYVVTIKDSMERTRREYFLLKHKWKIVSFARACGISDAKLTSGNFEMMDLLKIGLEVEVYVSGVKMVDGKEYDEHQTNFIPKEDELDDLPDF